MAAPTEREFARNIADLAHMYGWTLAHFRAARTEHGWRTPVEFDGKGFPDCVLVQPVRRLVWFRELKARGGRLEAAQQRWYHDLSKAGANVDIWRPQDWDDIVSALSNGRAAAS